MPRKKKNEELTVIKSENFSKTVKKKKVTKKEKPSEIDSFIPSTYQKNIFDYIVHEKGNLIIEACSGSGKTTTIIKCIELMPNDSTKLFAAFNKDIVKTLKKKIGKDDKIDIRTIHSLGYVMLMNHFGTYRLEMNEYKYSQYMQSDIFKKKIKLEKTNSSSFSKLFSNIKSLFQFSRCNLIDTPKGIVSLAEKYAIDLVGNEDELVIDLMNYGISDLNSFDFTDLIWLPNVLNLNDNNLKYDFIVVDEMQDVNLAQLNLILKCFKLGTRGIFVGDENQLIYGFTGTDTDSFQQIKNLPNTITLPLSISYRCPKKVVSFVKGYCPTIESKKDAIDGEILKDCDINEVQNGDAIICRNNAPLFKAYADLIKLGKSPQLLGNDISKNLESIVKSTKVKELNQDLNQDGMFSRLYYDLFSIKEKLMKKFGISEEDAYNSQIFIEKYDSIQALEILSHGLHTTEELINKIHNSFNGKKKDNIILTTAHKSKGLEFNNVFIICNSLFENDSVKLDWEKNQEKNLAYVAYTRTKNKLGFIDEKEYDYFLKKGNNKKQLFSNIEEKLLKIYNIKKEEKNIKRENIKNIDMNKVYNIPLINKSKPTVNSLKNKNNENNTLFSLNKLRNNFKK